MSHVLSLRLRDEQMERMRRVARRMNKSASETAATLLEEALRIAEFAFIQFRDSPVGRQAYIQGSSLAVWEVVKVARAHAGDVARAAASLEWPEPKAQAALNYAAAYPDEIEDAIRDSQPTYETLAHLLPGMRVFHSQDERNDGEPDVASSKREHGQ